MDPNEYDPEEEFSGDLPEFANELNKNLDQEIKLKERDLQKTRQELEDTEEKLQILTEHLKSVRTEHTNTQHLLDAKQKEIETEDHIKLLSDREAGRLRAEIQRVEREQLQLQDKLNTVQNNIFRGNEKMDQFKVQMNWNQEELEQWALAAKQKEEDNIALLKYTRADDTKIKDLNLQIEKLALEVINKKNELDNEVTETQAAQIELDKTAEDFRNLHKDRQDLVRQWEDAIEAMQRRDELIKQAGEKFATGKVEIRQKQEVLEEKKKFLEMEEANNKELENKIASGDRAVARLRIELTQQIESCNEFEDEVEVTRNTLAKAASDLALQKQQVASAEEDLKNKRARLEKSRRTLEQTQHRLENEYAYTDDLEKRARQADELYRQEKLRLKEVEKELAQLKDRVFKQSQELFKLRQTEANLIAEISGAQAAGKNLNAKIQRLDAESLKQKELIYNAEFQIQQLERKVSRAQGKRSDEEKKILNAKIKELSVALDEQVSQYKMLVDQSKKLQQDVKATRRKNVDLKKLLEKLTEKIAELNLVNETSSQKLRETVSKKDELLVQHDVMKLEVKRLRGQLQYKADEVLGLENRKFQLQTSMEEREKEVAAHMEILRAQLKAAEEDRHKAMQEYNERDVKIDKLKSKFQIVQGRMNSGEGADEEHTQAYYVIKAAQTREELQRKGDEYDEKIKKAEKDLADLELTLQHLNGKNASFRTSFSKVDQNSKEMSRKKNLDEKLTMIDAELNQRRTVIANLKEDIRKRQHMMHSMDEDKQFYLKNIEELNGRRADLESELIDQQGKLEHSQKQIGKLSKDHRMNKGVSVEDETVEEKDIRLIEMNEFNNYILHAIQQVGKEFPDIGGAIENVLQERGLVASNA